MPCHVDQVSFFIGASFPKAFRPKQDGVCTNAVSLCWHCHFPQPAVGTLGTGQRPGIHQSLSYLSLNKDLALIVLMPTSLDSSVKEQPSYRNCSSLPPAPCAAP